MDETNAGCIKRTRQHECRFGKCVPHEYHGENWKRTKMVDIRNGGIGTFGIIIQSAGCRLINKGLRYAESASLLRKDALETLVIFVPFPFRIGAL